MTSGIPNREVVPVRRQVAYYRSRGNFGKEPDGSREIEV